MLNKIRYINLLLSFCLLMAYMPTAQAQETDATEDYNDDILRINQLYKQGKWTEGKGLAEQELKKMPKNADLRMLVGKYYVQHRQYDQARYELVKALGEQPNNIEAKHMLITVESETKRYSSAICYINELLEANPYWKDLWRKKMDLYRAMGNSVEADRLLKRMAQIYPQDIDVQKDLAYAVEQQTNRLKKEGKMDEAVALAQASLADRPKDAQAYIDLIDMYIKAGDFGNAMVISERGLALFPTNSALIQKKIAILEHQQRYPEILVYLQSAIKNRNRSWSKQLDYFLLEAARQAKAVEPETLYGKVFAASPGNVEAFQVVFNGLIAEQQYEEAAAALDKHRRRAGHSKALDMRELSLYKRMGNERKVASLTKAFSAKYPNDTDLQDAMLTQTLEQAKANMQDGMIAQAIIDWKEVLRVGDREYKALAQQGLFNAYMVDKQFSEAAAVLDQMLVDAPNDVKLLLRKADVYVQRGAYMDALQVFETAHNHLTEQGRASYLVAVEELLVPVVKDLHEDYMLEEASVVLKRWLQVDPANKQALLYSINNAYQRQDQQEMLAYAKQASELYSDDITFSIKLAEAMNLQQTETEKAWEMLSLKIKQRPYHEPLKNSFSALTNDDAQRLIKAKDFQRALTILDTALQYDVHNKELKYLKGLAFEGLKNYDSAYQYQQFYEPSLLELDDFKQHLLYLSQRSDKNVFGIYHLRARYGEDYRITSISSADYTRITDRGTYTARMHYAGREEGKGIQGQLEWSKPWTEKLSSRIDVAAANKFFAQWMFNAALLYRWKPSWEAEIGAGYRHFFSKENLYNLNLGVTKELEDFRLSAKLSNFVLDETYLYSVFFRGQYFMNSPKNYLMVLGSVGNSPDVDLINYQLVNSFNVFNAMVGAGFGRSITRNVHAAVVGTWYNFQRDGSSAAADYRNFYNAYFQLNVSF